ELDERPTRARAKALTGWVHLPSSERQLVLRRAEEARVLHREIGDPWWIALSEAEYAARLCGVGEFDAALPLAEEAVERWRAVGDVHRELQAIRYLAWAYSGVGRSDRFRELHDEILVRARAVGDWEGEWWALSTLGSIASDEGRQEEALALLLEAYRGVEERGDRGGVEISFVRLAQVLARGGSPDAAARVLGTADAIHDEIGW